MRKTGIENEKDGIENECGCFGRSFDGYMVVEQAKNEREPFFSAWVALVISPLPGNASRVKTLNLVHLSPMKSNIKVSQNEVR